jgi:hypothetical protein
MEHNSRCALEPKHYVAVLCFIMLHLCNMYHLSTIYSSSRRWRYTPSRVRSCISSQRREVGSSPFWSTLMSHCLTAGPLGLVDDEFCYKWKMLRLQLFAQSKEASICSLDSPLYPQTHVIVRRHQGSQIHKFFGDFKSIVAKSHALPNVAIRLISTLSLLVEYSAVRL